MDLLQAIHAQNRLILERLENLEKTQLLTVRKESYTTAEVAERLHNRSEWTVRQWCNKGQAKAKKVRGRGRDGEWRLTHEELGRLQCEGPMAPGTFNNELRLVG